MGFNSGFKGLINKLPTFFLYNLTADRRGPRTAFSVGRGEGRTGDDLHKTWRTTPCPLSATTRYRNWKCIQKHDAKKNACDAPCYS